MGLDHKLAGDEKNGYIANLAELYWLSKQAEKKAEERDVETAVNYNPGRCCNIF